MEYNPRERWRSFLGKRYLPILRIKPYQHKINRFTAPHPDHHYSINLAAGSRRLDARDMFDLFAYPAFRRDQEARCGLLGRMLAAWIPKARMMLRPPARSRKPAGSPIRSVTVSLIPIS